MTNEFNEHYIDENELDKKIESGDITPVHKPKKRILSKKTLQKLLMLTSLRLVSFFHIT